MIRDERKSAVIRAESNPIFDYVIGDAYNIYPDDLGLRKFLRHIIYLKPDIFIIVDELETENPSTFQWLLHYEGELQKTAHDTFTLTNEDVELMIKVVLPREFKYDIYQQTAVRSEGQRTKTLPTLEISPMQEANQTVFMVILHPSKRGNQHPTVSEFESNGKMGLIIRDGDKTWKLLFDFARPKRNDRIFELLDEPEPVEAFYNFTRDLPPP